MRPWALVLCVLAGAPLFSRGRTPVETGTGGARLSAQECQVCHAREYAEWSGSRHAQAWTNALFTESFRQGRSPGCVNCHAPLVEQRAQVFEGAAREPSLLGEGVTCAVCHLREGVLLSAREPTEAARQAHPVREEPALRTADFCSGCHEFPVPAVGGEGGPESHVLMQQTLTEWRASSAARRGEGCVSCHMARGSHAFPGGHSREWLQADLEVSWERQGRSRLCARVRSRNAGHAVPTGDVFRRLRLRLCEDAACEKPVRQRLMVRRIAWGGAGPQEVEDSRLPPPSQSRASERTECFELRPGARAPAYWMLDLLYAEARSEARLPDSETRTVISSGALPQ